MEIADLTLGEVYRAEESVLHGHDGRDRGRDRGGRTNDRQRRDRTDHRATRSALLGAHRPGGRAGGVTEGGAMVHAAADVARGNKRLPFARIVRYSARAPSEPGHASPQELISIAIRHARMGDSGAGRTARGRRRNERCSTASRSVAGDTPGAPAPSAPLETRSPLEVIVTGTARSLTMVPISGGDGVASFWISSREITWDLYDIFVYGLDEPSGADRGGRDHPSQQALHLDGPRIRTRRVSGDLHVVQECQAVLRMALAEDPPPLPTPHRSGVAARVRPFADRSRRPRRTTPGRRRPPITRPSPSARSSPMRWASSTCWATQRSGASTRRANRSPSEARTRDPGDELGCDARRPSFARVERQRSPVPQEHRGGMPTPASWAFASSAKTQE